MSSNKVDNQNSNGVLGSGNRPLTTISHPVSPGAFCKPDDWYAGTWPVCPDCASRLNLVCHYTKSYPFDDLLEVALCTTRLACPTQGCGFSMDTTPSQPELPDRAEDA